MSFSTLSVKKIIINTPTLKFDGSRPENQTEFLPFCHEVSCNQGWTIPEIKDITPSSRMTDVTSLTSILWSHFLKIFVMEFRNFELCLEMVDKRPELHNLITTVLACVTYVKYSMDKGWESLMSL